MNSYANWLRTADPTELTRYDREQLRIEKEWLSDNPVMAATLDRYVGKRLTLVRAMRSYGRFSYKKGSAFVIVERWGPYLHGRPDGNPNAPLVSLLHEWVGIDLNVKRKLKRAASA